MASFLFREKFINYYDENKGFSRVERFDNGRDYGSGRDDGRRY